VNAVRSAPTRSLAACESGSALAEMAIVVPLLVLVLIALIEVGRFGDYTVRAGNAARAGVQYGAQNTITALDTAGMQNAATGDANAGAGFTATASSYCQCADGSASTCLATDCSTNHRLVFVEVDTTGTFPSLTNFAGLPASLRTITVHGKAVMRVAQ
jgi:Flp pilus assembly protein TadG